MSIHEYKLAFTTIEVIHVAAVSPGISTIAIVDLRLLGFASTKRPLTELTRAAWTWVAIAVAAVSGALFNSRATEYTSKTVFQVKLLVMLITGIAVLFVSLIGLAIWLLLASAKALEPDDTLNRLKRSASRCEVRASRPWLLNVAAMDAGRSLDRPTHRLNLP